MMNKDVYINRMTFYYQNDIFTRYGRNTHQERWAIMS